MPTSASSKAAFIPPTPAPITNVDFVAIKLVICDVRSVMWGEKIGFNYTSQASYLVLVAVFCFLTPVVKMLPHSLSQFDQSCSLPVFDQNFSAG